MRHIHAITIIVALCCLFFARLFIPTPQVIYTPDFLRSDSWYFNYPAKDFLAESLRAGHWPLWHKDIGTGIPIHAESQLGAFYPLNLLLYRTLPTWVAWNLTIILSFILNMVGMYWFLAHYSKSSVARLFGSLAYGFSALFAIRIIHLNHLQSLSLLPWVVWSGLHFYRKPQLEQALVYSFISANQLLLGHFQFAFISQVGLLLLIISEWLISLKTKKSPLIQLKFNHILWGCISLVLIFGLSAVQVLPSLTLRSESAIGSQLDPDYLFEFPFPLRQWLSYLSPNFFGNYQNATYSTTDYPLIGLFWENTSYIGLIPLGLALWYLVSNRQKQTVQSLGIFISISGLLVMGHMGILRTIFELPGFSYFRIPARFLVLPTLGLVVLATKAFVSVITKIHQGSHRLMVSGLIMGLTLVDLTLFGFNFHALIPLNQALSAPEIIDSISPSSRLSTNFTHHESWFEEFSVQGWQDIEPYLWMKNGLAANANGLYGLSHILAYGGLLPKRVTSNLPRAEFIGAQSIDYVISTQPILDTQVVSLAERLEAPKADRPDYYLYHVDTKLPRFRLAHQVIHSSGLVQTKDLITNQEIDYQTTAIIEANQAFNLASPSAVSIEVIEDEHQYQSLRLTTDQPSLLIIADSYSADWQATVNGQPTPIYPANLNQRAIKISSGTSNIELTYMPESFRQGLFLSTLAWIGWSGAGVICLKKKTINKLS